MLPAPGSLSESPLAGGFVADGAVVGSQACPGVATRDSTFTTLESQHRLTRSGISRSVVSLRWTGIAGAHAVSHSGVAKDDLSVAGVPASSQLPSPSSLAVQTSTRQTTGTSLEQEGGRAIRPVQPRLRPGQIMAPSSGSSNNPARVRNIGSGVGWGSRGVGAGTTGVGRSESEPGLHVKGSLEVVGQLPLSPTTPRTLRGNVRKASAVTMTYPELPPGSPLALSVASWKRPLSLSSSSSPSITCSTAFGDTVLASQSSGVSTPSSSSSPPQRKRVTFFDFPGGHATVKSPTGPLFVDDDPLNSVGLRRSRRLMDSLYELRRAKATRKATTPAEANLGDQSDAPGPGTVGGSSSGGADGADVDGVQDEVADEPLLVATLKDTEDSEAELRLTEATMLSVTAPVRECGGTRHATAVISGRTLAVIQRKAHILQACEARLKAFEEAQARREEIRAMLLAEDCQPPQELVGIDRFTKSWLHKDGKPEEANKSNFHIFVSSFGLPHGHCIVKRLLEVGSKATQWWAKAALAEAKKGTDTAGVHRCIELAVDILGNKEHAAIVECRTVLGNCLAENVLKSALEQQAKDEALCASFPNRPQPESARKTAEFINTEITTAVSMGAPNKHPSLTEAKSIAVNFEREEKDRVAETVMLSAQNIFEKDAAAADKCEGVPPVGPASEAADRIEKEIQAVVADRGIPENHELLQEAKRIAKSLRDEDGQRKRMAAREKRLAEIAAKSKYS
eukprot:TRINITY_DN54840_c0_g1_i1.p1 TRINITY_DN54840_c0_g1~~TRINITY_DN54840_c0_g1_i1.p1  ORF type:complete len:738 (+),score=147.80 TRINITY_DN54840_c0_g1_i1:55-2268(+)